MAEKIRDLEISNLSTEQVEALSVGELRRLKPIASKQFDALPKETQEKLFVLYDQSMVIWNDENKMRNLSHAEIVDLLEPYKTRSFKTFPKFLKEDMMELYLRGVHNPKLSKLLLWFVDKRDFNEKELPSEIYSFLDNTYAKNPYEYDEESFKTLIGGIRKLQYMDLSDNQKAFLRSAFEKDVDKMTNEQLFALVNYVKNATALGAEYNRMPTNMQNFVLECYKRCVVKTETSANNLKMTGSWHRTNEDQYRCFAAFNRAFVGLDKIDRAMYFEKPAKKLNLPNLINYANMQREYISNGLFSSDVYKSAKQIAEELNLPQIYEIYNESYHFDSRVLLPYTKVDAYYIDERDGIMMGINPDQTRTYNIETEREYKDRVATPLAKTFDGMIDYYIRIATKDFAGEKTLTPEEQQKASDYLISVFDGDITNHCEAVIDNIATDYEFKTPVFVQKAKETLCSLMNVEAMKENLASKTKEKERWQKTLTTYLQNLSEDELEDWLNEKHSRAEINVYKAMLRGDSSGEKRSYGRRELSEEARLQEINSILNNPKLYGKLSSAEKSDLVDEYYNLEDKLYDR